jgi:hypothetical protein
MLFTILAGLIAAATPFQEVVKSHFDTWDADHDGTLSATEIDCLSVDHSIHGDSAAAVASLKLARRSTKVTYPPFTRDYFLSNENDGDDGVVAGSEQDDHDRAERAKGRKGLADRYNRALRRINGAKRDLFLDQTPDIDACHQGALGDCFLVAAIGATVHRDSNSLKEMIAPKSGGGYTVNFKYGGQVQVPPLTDAQICLTSTTGDEGLWLPVLEEAYGIMRTRNTQPKAGAEVMEEGSDAIAHGGSMRSTIKALTGNETKGVNLKSKLKPDQSNLNDLADTFRMELKKAIDDNRLAGLGTSKDDTPPGISGNHAYAILAFDAAKDEVKIWNPHGNSFKPKGEAGIKNGFPTSRGVFTVPLTEVVRIFRGATFETLTAAKKS